LKAFTVHDVFKIARFTDAPYIYHQLPLTFFGVRYAIVTVDYCITCSI